jgi:hypothetical protein
MPDLIAQAPLARYKIDEGKQEVNTNATLYKPARQEF